MSAPRPNPNPDLPIGLFPIPNLVVFPGLLQALHVFEPRYRALTQDALDGDRRFALAIPYDSQPSDSPQLAPVACAVKIARHVTLPDGRFHLQVLGVSRVLIQNELPLKNGYRQAQVEWLPEQTVDPLLPQTTRLRNRLCDMFRDLLLKASSSSGDLSNLLQATLPLHLLTNLISFVVPFPLDWKLKLLAEPNPLRRAELLLEMKAAIAPEDASQVALSDAFPPDFSTN